MGIATPFWGILPIGMGIGTRMHTVFWDSFIYLFTLLVWFS